jgi:hypothetical protein
MVVVRGPYLADPNEVLGLDETGVLNKGQPSAGVARAKTVTRLGRETVARWASF